MRSAKASPTSPETRPVHVVPFGLGAIGKHMAQILLEKGAIIVGAVDTAPDVIGKDVGEVLDLPAPLGVTVIAPDDPTFETLSADIAVFAARRHIKEMFPHHKACLEAGMNVIDIGAEVSWGWHTEPGLSAQLDAIARANGVTISGSGNQELTVGAAMLLASECHTIKSIWHKTRADVDDFGPVIVNYCHIGEPAESYVSDGDAHFPGIALFTFMLVSELKLTIDDVKLETHAITSSTPRWSKVLEREIAPGEIVGLNRIVHITTRQGVALSLEEEVSVLVDENDGEYKEWVVDGDPPISMRMDLKTKRSTAVSAVNRIPDVIAAEPGYRTIDLLGRHEFQPYPYRVPA